MNTPAATVELLELVAFDELTLADRAGAVQGGSRLLAAGTHGFWATAHPDDLTDAQRVWQAMLASAPRAVRCCLRLKHSDGSWRWIEASLCNLLDDPRLGQVAINWRDVTHAPQTGHSNELVLRLAPDGTLRAVSPTSVALLGPAPEALVGTDYFTWVHPDDAAAVRNSHATASEKVTAVPSYRVRRSGHGWAWLESNVRRVAGDELLVIAHDVTHKRLADEQFLQAQKMDAVGRLAGGVAHDFNNLLSIITSATTLLQDELTPAHPARDMAEEIRVACRRAADLTRQLLAFSRRQMLIAAPVSVNEIVTTVLDELRPQLGGAVRLVTQLDPAVGIIQVDAQQLERVLASVVINAKDAMPQGGTITLTTSNLTVSPDDLEVADAVPGEYVRLEVRDEGVGMNALTRAHLFEPFFTTKPRGKGVGLGLATAYGIVRQSNGHIRVRSEEGDGTSIALLFPHDAAAKAAAAPAAGKAPTSTDAVTTGTETILLVEDDSAVRRVAAALLTKKGYRVIQADGGKEALAITDAELGRINLLLTDVMMPGMTGPQIATALQARRPGLRVLFMSGFNNESVPHILHKPFTLETLTRRVRELLDASP